MGKIFKETLEKDILNDMFPLSHNPNTKANEVIYQLFESSTTGMEYTDLTRRLSYHSSRGNVYILVGYNYDVNAILVCPIKIEKQQR